MPSWSQETSTSSDDQNTTTIKSAPRENGGGWWAGGMDRMGWAGSNETAREEGEQVQLERNRLA